MTNDGHLLREYSERKSEQAFAELVQRHVDFVYGVALRQLDGNVHRAKDVAQNVFIDLARKARPLSDRVTIVGWLHISVHHAAAQLRRSEQRRKRREQEAHNMQEYLREPADAADWEQIRPLLDTAIGELSDHDRDAVLLRFFKQRPFAEIGATLQIGEEGARKRVARALDKLHSVLAKRGITSTAAAIGTVLANQPAVAAPAGFATTAIQAALVAGATGTTTMGALKILFMSKIQMGIIGSIVAAGFVTTLLQFNQARALTAEFRSVTKAAGQFVALQRENENLNKQISGTTTPADREELARLRNQIAALKACPADVDESKMVPVAQMKNAGWATPAASFETLTWAQNQPPDTFLDLFAASFRFDPATKAKADAFFATLSADVRAKFKTPERLFAPLFFGEGSAKNPIVAVQILGQTNHDNDPDQVVLRWWQVSANGGGFEGRMNLTRVGDEWLQARSNPIRDDQWQKIIAQIDPLTGTPRNQKR